VPVVAEDSAHHCESDCNDQAHHKRPPGPCQCRIECQVMCRFLLQKTSLDSRRELGEYPVAMISPGLLDLLSLGAPLARSTPRSDRCAAAGAAPSCAPRSS